MLDELALEDGVFLVFVPGCTGSIAEDGNGVPIVEFQRRNAGKDFGRHVDEVELDCMGL